MSKIKDFILKNLENHSKDIVTFAAKKLSVSRQAVHKNLSQLIESGEVHKTGVKKSSSYFLTRSQKRKFRIKVTPGLLEDTVWTAHLESICRKLPENAYRILYYAFTEMLNNVIDHAQAKIATIEFEQNGNTVLMSISDDGIGVFKKIQTSLHLKDLKESLLHLTKGKLTTNPTRHTGEGIFFTSRAVDQFTLTANGISFLRQGEEDWSVTSDSSRKKGTSVELVLNINTKQNLKRLFEKYTDAESYEFNRTVIHVALAKKAGQELISRSQAKRILLGLEKFTKIILDFKDVKFVGQGFVDEVFRVFQSQHPGIKIEWIQANSDIEFMIKRSLG